MSAVVSDSDACRTWNGWVESKCCVNVTVSEWRVSVSQVVAYVDFNLCSAYSFPDMGSWKVLQVLFFSSS